MKFTFPVLVCLVGLSLLGAALATPEGFATRKVLNGLKDPASMRFTPDGTRLFISERVSGRLRVAIPDPKSDRWLLNPTPFHTFDIPKDTGGNPQRHRSRGLRGFTFDPNFEKNGYLYAFHTANNPRHNRVVRIQASAGDRDISADGSETVLMDLPFGASSSSGSHNGGAMEFGTDGKLYFTTGDGWNGGDPVQSLTSHTGKLWRINPDGSIPTDNPFYQQAKGKMRGIYCLGLRNPYTLSIHPDTGELFVNDAVGQEKDAIFLVEPAANFGHQGFRGIGELKKRLTSGGSPLITGGAWYPTSGPAPRPFPKQFHGNYFTVFWGKNSALTGCIRRHTSRKKLQSEAFAVSVQESNNKPVMARIGPHDGNLYYLLTHYATVSGSVQQISFTNSPLTEAPKVTPAGGQFDDPISVAIKSSNPDETIRFTLDGSKPGTASHLYTKPIVIKASGSLRARAFGSGKPLPSSISSAEFVIGTVPNLPPKAIAGPDRFAEVNKLVRINGGSSSDPDDDPLEIDEKWKQIAGPKVRLGNNDEAEAYFTPKTTGRYVFHLTISDPHGAVDSDEVQITVVDKITDPREGLVACWSFDQGSGQVALDGSGGSNLGRLSGSGVTWDTMTADSSPHSVRFDGSSNARIDLGTLDLDSDGCTFTFWFKANDFGTHDARFISKASGQDEHEHYWMLSTMKGSMLRFRLNTGGKTTTLASPPKTLGANEWIHVAAVYDGKRMSLYKDSVEVATAPKVGRIATNPGVRASIGNQPAGITGGSRPFDGQIDELRIYSRALGADEIKAVMKATNPE